MNEFFSSKFVKDLGNGQLPPVEVKFSTESLVQVGATLIFSAVIILLVAKIFKSL